MTPRHAQLRAIHDACHPGAHNEAYRTPDFTDDELDPVFGDLTDADVDDVGAIAGLWAALDDEADDEATDGEQEAS